MWRVKTFFNELPWVKEYSHKKRFSKMTIEELEVEFFRLEQVADGNAPEVKKECVHIQALIRLEQKKRNTLQPKIEAKSREEEVEEDTFSLPDLR